MLLNLKEGEKMVVVHGVKIHGIPMGSEVEVMSDVTITDMFQQLTVEYGGKEVPITVLHLRASTDILEEVKSRREEGVHIPAYMISWLINVAEESTALNVENKHLHKRLENAIFTDIHIDPIPKRVFPIPFNYKGNE